MDSSSVIASDCIDPKASDDTINTDLSEKAFDALINNIKTEKCLLFPDESSYFEDSANKAYTKKDVYFSESYSQELTGTKLVDGKIVSMDTSYPSTTLPIMKISSPKAKPHVCLEYCFKCNNIFRILDTPLHISQLRSIEKKSAFLRIDPSLFDDSCLCDFCWKALNKIYVYNRSQVNQSVESPNALVDPAPIRRKRSNVIYDIISNKNVKKRRLNKKYSSYENNSISYNTNKSYRNKNIAHVSPLQSNHTLEKNPHFHDREKSSKKKCVKNFLLDKHITDSDSLSDSEIIVLNTNDLLDSEIFSNNDSEEIFPDHELKKTDFLVVAPDDGFSLDSNREFVKSKLEINPDYEIEMIGENILDSVKDLNYEIVPDVETESDYKILLDDDKVLDIASWSETGTIKYKVIYDNEVKPSGNKGSTCIIISDNDDELHNKVFLTHKINVLKGSDTKILFDGEKVKILSESENRKTKYEIKPDNKNSNICIIIFDNENEFINKNLSTLKIVSDVKEGSEFEKLLNGDKVYDIESDSKKGKINYTIVSEDKIISSTNEGSQCTITSNKKKKCNHKKSAFYILVKNIQKESHFEKWYNYKKVSDIKIMPNDIVYDSLGLKILDENNTINNDSKLQINCRHSFPYLELAANEDGETQQDRTQEYFKDIFFAIKYFFQNTENQSLKELYSQIGNEADMLLYLMENLRMFYNEELVVSETADELTKNYLNEQKTTLYNYFGDPKDSINASKPFIHPSSRLHQYSKRLSSYIEPIIIKNITTATSTSTRSSTVAPPKNNVALHKCVGSKFIRSSKLLPLCSSVESRLIPHLPVDNQQFAILIVPNRDKIRNIQYPVAIKKKTVRKS